MHAKRLIPLLCPLLVLGGGATASAGAPDIVDELHSDGASLQQGRVAIDNEIQRQLDIRTARRTLAQAQTDLQHALELERQALATLQQREQAIVAAEQALAAATNERDSARSALTAAQEAAQQSLLELEAARATARQAESTARQADAAIRRLEAELTPNAPLATLENADFNALLRQAEDAARQIDAAQNRAAGYWQRADRLTEALDRQEAATDGLLALRDAAADALQSAEDRLAAAVDALRDAHSERDDAAAALPAARQDVSNARQSLLEVTQELTLLENPPPDNRIYYSARNAYFSAKGSDGSSGYQWLQTYSFSTSTRGLDISLNGGYAVANSSLGARISTPLDSQLSVAHTNSNRDYPVRYELALSLPTGTSALTAAESRSLLDEDLVPLGRFGDGWKVTPAVSIMRPIGQEDSWTLGSSLQLQWQYQPTAGDPSSITLPGRQTSHFLRWQHLGAAKQSLAELRYTSSATTQQNNVDYYREGAQWDLKLVQRWQLNQRDSLQLHGRTIYHQADSYADPAAAPSANNGLHSYFGGLVWSRTLSPQRTLRVNADYLRRQGSISTPNLPTAIGDRSRFSFGIGLDWQLSADRGLSFDVKRYSLHNSASSGAPNYTGTSFQLSFHSAL